MDRSVTQCVLAWSRALIARPRPTPMELSYRSCVGREGPDETIALLNFEGLRGMAFEVAKCPVLS